MAKTVKVGEADSLKPGSGKTVEVEGRKIALFNVDGSYCAIDDACTHGAGFNVRTGAATGPPASSEVCSFTVKIEGNDILVELD